MTEITVKPFNWNDNFSKEALEDFENIQKDLPYCTCQNIGMALAKLELLEKQGCKIDQWIPVTEKMPKKFSDVNCTCHSLIDDREDWVVETCYIPQPPNSPYSDWGNIPMLNHGECEVIAWMYRDIPEPYKVEKEGQGMTHKENIRAILECYFTGFKEEIINSACNRIVELEPKIGHWIASDIPNEDYVCSECGGACWYYDYQATVKRSEFCPNCGAKMVEPKEHEDKRMKKVFISQPMNGLSDLQIEKDRARVIECLHNLGYTPNKITIIDTHIEENAPNNVNSGLWYLGKSLELLADADIAVFAKGWRNARGCLIEFECAMEYGISCIYED